MARIQDDLDKPANSIIGKGLTIQASLITGSDSIRVDGVLVGVLELDTTIHISESGFIEGDIRAASARIAGQVNGNIHCNSTLHLASTAMVTGDIYAASVIVDEGAVLRGRFTSGAHVEAQK